MRNYLLIDQSINQTINELINVKVVFLSQQQNIMISEMSVRVIFMKDEEKLYRELVK